MMSKIFTYPVFQHLTEKVFVNLDVENLKMCAKINQSCKQILKNSMFWLKKFGQLSKENQDKWIKIIHSVKNSNLEIIIVSYLQWTLTKKVEEVDLPYLWFKKFRSLSMENQKDWIKVIESKKNSVKENAIMSYLQWNFRKEVLVDIPCCTSPTVQDHFRKIILQMSKTWWQLSTKDIEIVKIYAPLMDNPNASVENENTPIFWAAYYGHTELVKILAPLTDNPNAPNNRGDTPIHWAACSGHTEIVKILAPLTGNPNAPKNDGSTPIYWAAVWGHTEIVKILAPLTDTPNASNNQWQTPFAVAKNEEIRGILFQRGL